MAKNSENLDKKIPATLNEDWWLFCDSYLSAAELACREMIDQKYKVFKSKKGEHGPLRFWVYNLYIPMIYNLKHAIEIFLKYFLIVIEDKMPELGKNGHDIEKYLELFKSKHNVELINRAIKGAIKQGKKTRFSLEAAEFETEFHQKWMENMNRLVIKYFKCEDIISKIGNFSLIDRLNDGFRYPVNQLGVSLNYSELIGKINKEDIKIVLKDIYELKNDFNSLRFMIEVNQDIK